MSIKDVLVASDTDLAKQAGEVMRSTIDENFLDCLQSLKESLLAYQGATSISEQRSIFSALTEDMYALAKAHPNEQTVYKQYCPMALDAMGASWLSLSEEIENPYFGASMLKCGSVKEKIKVVR